jgi:hypothetical protein
MASFTGTKKEFRRYVGPRLRNLVQQITKDHRLRISSCEHCGSAAGLQAAHVRGRDRNQIIDLILDRLTREETFTIDIVEFEKSFKAEHEPLETAILILCSACHKQYDLPTRSQRISEGNSSLNVERDGYLPINFVPADSDEFKRELLRTRTAEIITTYRDGRVETKVWNAQNFRATSNVIGNLRSRPEFRNGNWQSRGIREVTVCILK